jgi:hypothetical protein
MTSRQRVMMQTHGHVVKKHSRVGTDSSDSVVDCEDINPIASVCVRFVFAHACSEFRLGTADLVL